MLSKSKTQIVTKFKNSNCDKTQKLKWWQNSKTQIVTKLKNSNVTKLKLWQNSSCEKNSSCDKTTFCDKTQIVTKLELWQNSSFDKTQIVRKNQNLECYKTQIVTVVTVVIKYIFFIYFLFYFFFFFTVFLQQTNFTKKSKTQIVMKLKNSNGDKTQKLKGLRRLVQLNRHQKF